MSGVRLFRGALEGENLFSSLIAAGDWVKKGSCHTAWWGPCGSSCTCSYAYGQGPAIGPQIGERCWPLLAGVWRAIAPLMKPWCAEGEAPTAANLNVYRGCTAITSLFWVMKPTCAGLSMVTAWSWMANARTSSFIVRILVGNRNG